MSERETITAMSRTVVGKQVSQLRRDGLVPAIIYGQGQPTNIQLDNKTLRRVLRKAGTTNLVDIILNETTRTVLARDVQQHPVRHDLLHVDFLEVNMFETLTSEAELVAVGQPGPAIRNLGTVTLAIHSVEIECLPGDLISQIQVDFGRIQAATDVIYVRDLVVPAGVKILEDADAIVISFEYSRDEAADDGLAPTADAVEVIKKGKIEEEKF